ncbi:MAG: WD40 repeat domain-containing protein [Caldilineaceae bacterium]
MGATKNNEVFLWQADRLAEGAEKLSVNNTAIKAVAFSPDGKWLAIGSDDATVDLRYVNNPQTSRFVFVDHEKAVNAVAFSPDSRWIATCADDSTVWLRQMPDSNNGSTVWQELLANPVAPMVFPSDSNAVVESVAFSPDNHWLASGTTDNTVHLWNMNEPQAAAQILSGHEKWVVAVDFSSDSQWLASSSLDKTVRLWDMNDLRVAASVLNAPADLARENAGVNAVAFSPNNQWLAAGFVDNSIRVWNTNNLAEDPVALIDHVSSVWTLAFSTDSHWLASGGCDKTLRLWDMTDLWSASTASAVFEHDACVLAAAFSPDGRWLATASGEPFATIRSESDRTIWLWDTANFPTVPDPINLTGYTGSVWNIAFSPDSRWLATASTDKTARLWLMEDLHGWPTVLTGHTDGVLGVAFSSDGRWIATGSSDGNVRLWPQYIDDLIDLACRGAGRNMTLYEWQRYFGDEPYHKSCERWPIHSSVIQALPAKAGDQIK